MKNILITIALLITVTGSVFAQHFELSLQAGSAFNKYSGNGTSASSFIIEDGTNNYTNNPYSSKLTFGYSFNADAKLVAPFGLLAGVQGGYELLKSDMPIDKVEPITFELADNYRPEATFIPAHGTTTLQSNTININPFIGYRINAHLIKIDLMPGVDIALRQKFTDKGQATDNNNNTYKVDQTLDSHNTDVRLRFGVAVILRRFEVTAAYSHGLSNHLSDVMNDNNVQVHSNIIRLGIGYRLF